MANEWELDYFLRDIGIYLLARNNEMIRDKPNLTLTSIKYFSIKMAKWFPLVGRGYKPLPKFLALKKSIVNIQNTDERCFGYSICCYRLFQEYKARTAQEKETQKIVEEEAAKKKAAEKKAAKALADALSSTISPTPPDTILSANTIIYLQNLVHNGVPHENPDSADEADELVDDETVKSARWLPNTDRPAT